MKRVRYFVFFLLITSYAQAQDTTIQVLVVYHSLTGKTAQMAEAVAQGAKSVEGVTVQLKTIKETTKDDILAAHAIIVGSPVHNANITPAAQRFINSWPFKDQPMKDKIGAAFVTAGGISAGEELALMNILHSMLIYNMIVVGGADWKSAFGASAITEENPSEQNQKDKRVDQYYLRKGEALGKRVAELTKTIIEKE